LLPQLQLLSKQLQYTYKKYGDAGDHLLPQLQLLSKQLQYIRNIVMLAITCCRSFSCSPSN
jgi:hypothetical protein